MFGENDKKTPMLRLLKVVVQPVMVVDDGENLQELTIDSIVVQPKDWPTYATGRFNQQIKELQDKLTASQASAQQAQGSVTNGMPPTPGSTSPLPEES